MSSDLTAQKQIRRALLSVTDKTGLVEFARVLAGFGVELVSTGGTARALREAGLNVKDISDLTGFPEMLDGRVKTLHPKVHGGLLYIRGNLEHEAAVAAHGIAPIDMVVVNLYAFEKTAAQPGVAFGHLIENIDIGGPSMVRSAAKNFEDVAIVTRTSDYPALTEELKSAHGALSRETRWRLARQAFALTAAYDSAIANTLDGIKEAPAPDAPASPDADALPTTLRINLPRSQSLRYGENPHQRAALYADGSGLGVAGATQLQGKELSYNNLVDLDACWELVQEFADPAAIIVKHTNPCGAAIGANGARCLQKGSRMRSGFGFRHPSSASTARWTEPLPRRLPNCLSRPLRRRLSRAEARERFAAKKNLRLVEVQLRPNAPGGQAGVRRNADAGCRQGQSHRERAGHRYLASTHAGGVAQPAVRLERVQAREVERHCVCARRADHRHRRGTDEPGGRSTIRRHEGSAPARGLRCRIRCVLPVPRRP